MNNLLTICKKELLDFKRSRFFVLLCVFLAFVMVLSVTVAAADYRGKIADYNLYVSALKASGAAITIPEPPFYPLQLLRGSVEYLELIGALFAAIIGYGMIAKEKSRGTLDLMYSRRLGRYTLPLGKIAAFSIVWLISIMAIFTVTTFAVVFVGNASLHGIDYQKLCIGAGLAWVYLILWSCIGMGFAASNKRLSTALVVTLVLWLVVVLIIPQIGDTMDPDNQVPGGLFKSLQVDKAHEKAVIAKFVGFESARNAIEVTSITKHYERPSFAYLGFKDDFNQKPLGYVFSKTYPNTLWLFGGLAGSVGFAVLASSKKKLLRKGF